jgi:hypothetical protein
MQELRSNNARITPATFKNFLIPISILTLLDSMG